MLDGTDVLVPRAGLGPPNHTSIKHEAAYKRDNEYAKSRARDTNVALESDFMLAFCVQREQEKTGKCDFQPEDRLKPRTLQ